MHGRRAALQLREARKDGLLRSRERVQALQHVLLERGLGEILLQVAAREASRLRPLRQLVPQFGAAPAPGVLDEPRRRVPPCLESFGVVDAVHKNALSVGEIEP